MTVGFRELKHTNVLIYWPHGFGDWVFLGYVLPFLESSNRYFITRFGDDSTALFDGCQWVTPLFVGLNSTHCDDGGAFGIRHFALEEMQSRRGDLHVHLPLALADSCQKFSIDALLHLPFPETYGGTPFPFHSKGRNMLRHLVASSRLPHTELNRPLPNVISFDVPPNISAWVESRLRTWAGYGGRKLCIIGRNGYTSVGKNWGHLWREEMPPGRKREGEECRDFMRLMLRKDPKWIFVIMEDRIFSGDDTMRDRLFHCFSYAELFGTPDDFSPPFGLVMKALINVADLVVGVPAGPYHLAMAKPETPVVGIWTEHIPSWYDEPKPASIHLMSNNLKLTQVDRRSGTLLNHTNFDYRMEWLDTRIVPGEQVLYAVEKLLGI
jgi:hypothetical protein